jgi:hypothetical protein
LKDHGSKVVNMTGATISEIADTIAGAINLETKLVCAYGCDQIPEKGIRSSSISDCVASAIYQIAAGKVTEPLYVGDEPGQSFCRCIGGPAWFGFGPFDPRLMGLIATGSMDIEDSAPKYLKESETIAHKSYQTVGEIAPLGRYVVMRSCHDMSEDTGLRCMVCFATAAQIRDLCALAHFRRADVFDAISIPWGPACATMVTYPAGMAENASADRIYAGPADSSSKEWLPEDCMVLGIPFKIAGAMAEDIERSFIGRRSPK